MMKNVWILNHYALAPTEAGGTRHFHIAENLAALGWQATIIAASVEFTTGKQRLNREETHRHDWIGGVPFLWVRTPEYQGNGRKRMLNMLAYTWQVLRRQTTEDLPSPDVVVGSSVHPLAAAAGAILARRFKVPFVFEVRDLWPQTLIDMGRLREGSFVAWVLRKLEHWLYQRAARIIVLLPRAWEYITPLGIERERIVWIPNGVDFSLFPNSIGKAPKSSDSFSLMYFGAHGQANDLENILKAMKCIQEKSRDRRIQLRMVGDGPLKANLQALAQELKLTNVIFEAPVPKAMISQLASEADAFVISVPDLPKLYRYGISPNKLFDYFAAGKPVIIATGITDNPVFNCGAGFSVPAEHPVALAEAILQMSSFLQDERERMGQAGRKYVEENHSFQILSSRFAAVLNDVEKILSRSSK